MVHPDSGGCHRAQQTPPLRPALIMVKFKVLFLKNCMPLYMPSVLSALCKTAFGQRLGWTTPATIAFALLNLHIPTHVHHTHLAPA